jgi:nicotinamide-nucleotide amidase
MYHDKSIAAIATKLLEKHETIAAAESVTSGLLQAALSSADNASQFFQGGITAYNIGQKSRLLQIDPIHAIACNCVSQKMAVDMAISVCKLFTSHWGMAITGYASPVPESDGDIFAYYAICYRGRIVDEGRIEGVGSDARQVQLHFANYMLDKLAAVTNGSN